MRGCCKENPWQLTMTASPSHHMYEAALYYCSNQRKSITKDLGSGILSDSVIA